MARLVLSGRIRGQVTTLCDFTIAVNGGGAVSPDAVVLDQSIFTIPDASAQIEVRAGSFEPATLGTVTARLEIDSFGSIQATFLGDGWEPLTVLPTPFGLTALMAVHFSPVRDATERARLSLDRTGSDYPGAPPAPPPGDMSFRSASVPLPPAAYSPLPQATDTSFIASSPIENREIQIETRNVTPFGELVVLQFPGVRTPQLAAVYWPSDVPRGPGAPPAPFLVYFHSGMAQNVPDGFYLDPRDRHDPMTNEIYPWGWDFQFFGLLRYLGYFGDPLLDEPHAKGLPYQIQASGRNVVLVLPLPRVAGSPCDEIGSFADAVFVQNYLEEIQAFMRRKTGNFSFGTIGRVGMASFSSGHGMLSCFLARPANHSHPFYLDTLQEIYLFDPHGDSAHETLAPVTQVAAWSARGAAGTKIAHLYTQLDPSVLGPLLAPFGLASGVAPLHTQTADGRKSLTCLPKEAWGRLVQQLGSTVPYTNSAQAHQVISAMMLTDALRRSAF